MIIYDFGLSSQCNKKQQKPLCWIFSWIQLLYTKKPNRFWLKKKKLREFVKVANWIQDKITKITCFSLF